MKKIALITVLLAGLCSCRKMAFQHTCECTVKRISGGTEEIVSVSSEKELGTYKTALDSCKRREAALSYTTYKTEGNITQQASCELN